MKTAASILAALLLGLVLGTWSVKADLRKAQSEIAELKRKQDRKGGNSAALGGIRSMLKIPEPERARHAAGREAVPAEASIQPPDDVAGPTTGPAVSNAATRHTWRRFGTNSIRDHLETAADAWRVRSDLARNSFVSNVATTSDQSVQFDVIMAAMNIRLSNNVRTWVDYVKQQDELTPETGIRMMSDLSGSLVFAYNDLDRAMPADWRAKAGSQFQVFDFIDPRVALPLTEVEDVIRQKDPAAPADAGDDAGPHVMFSAGYTVEGDGSAPDAKSGK